MARTESLLVAEAVPAWRSSRLKRLVHQPKRYLVDAALIAAALRTDVAGVIQGRRGARRGRRKAPQVAPRGAWRALRLRRPTAPSIPLPLFRYIDI
jgi:hypothetical protein